MLTKMAISGSRAAIPFSRINTGDNTPAILHTSIVQGEQVRIVVMPKGGGSENYGEARMLAPSEGREGVKAFVKEMVQEGGPESMPADYHRRRGRG